MIHWSMCCTSLCGWIMPKLFCRIKLKYPQCKKVYFKTRRWRCCCAQRAWNQCYDFRNRYVRSNIDWFPKSLLCRNLAKIVENSVYNIEPCYRGIKVVDLNHDTYIYPFYIQMSSFQEALDSILDSALWPFTQIFRYVTSLDVLSQHLWFYQLRQTCVCVHLLCALHSTLKKLQPMLTLCTCL
jgi:hypothetical protein